MCESPDESKLAFLQTSPWSSPSTRLRKRAITSPPPNTNTRRGVSTVFTSEDVEKFCMRNDIDLIIRAHECVVPGWSATAGGRCITVFSAPKYCGTHRNAGALLEITRDLLVQCKKILCDESEGKWVNIRDATPPPSPTRPSGITSKKRNFRSFEHRLRVIPEADEEDENRIEDIIESKLRSISTSPPPPPPPPPQSLMLAVKDVRGQASSRLVVLSPRRRDKRGNVVASVGRSNECKVTIPNTCDLVSREHLRIELIDGNWYAMDVSSMGTACRHVADGDVGLSESVRDKKMKKNGHSNEGNDHRMKPSKLVPIKDGMHFFLGSYRAGGAVVKAKLLSPKAASVHKKETRGDLKEKGSSSK